MPSVNLMERDLAAQSIPVNSEHFRRFALIALGLNQRGLDELLLKSSNSFVEEYVFLNHLADQ